MAQRFLSHCRQTPNVTNTTISHHIHLGSTEKMCRTKTKKTTAQTLNHVERNSRGSGLISVVKIASMYFLFSTHSRLGSFRTCCTISSSRLSILSRLSAYNGVSPHAANQPPSLVIAARVYYMSGGYIDLLSTNPLAKMQPHLRHPRTGTLPLSVFVCVRSSHIIQVYVEFTGECRMWARNNSANAVDKRKVVEIIY